MDSRAEKMSEWLSRIGAILFFVSLPLCAIAQLQVQAVNLTGERNALESMPGFVLDDTKVVFLEFCGVADDAEPWDFRLGMMDIGGSQVEYLTGTGIVAYSRANSHTLRLLRKASIGDNIILASQNDNAVWEICQLDLHSGNLNLLSTVHSSLTEAYELMEGDGTGFYGEVVSEGANHYYHLYHSKAGEHPAFRTELYKTYSDVAWQPEAVWETDRHFLTLNFESIEDKRFPQNAGLFSIVRVDIETGVVRVLETGVAPFPRFCLDSANNMLYFQKESGLVVELWRLDLTTGNSQRLYSAIGGSLGRPSLSRSGNLMVLNQQVGDDFEIVKLEIGSGSVTMAGPQ